MRTRTAICAIVLLLLAAASVSAAARSVLVLTLSGPIEAAVAQYIQSGIAEAGSTGAEAVVIQLDTPGGGYEPMRTIVQAELNSDVPVIVYVPRGARAGSAGTFITLAANVAALAPGSNIGSAHPVFDFPVPAGGRSRTVDPTMMGKVVNDSAAYIASIAEERGRNASWAEDAVRKSANVSANAAVKLKVIDFVANSLPDLLSKADGMKVRTAAGTKTLHTKNAETRQMPMGWTTGLLQKLGDPTIAFILMLVAIFGIIFEVSTPGSIGPGVIGGIALVLLFLSFSIITLNVAGLLLVLLALAMFIVDLKVPSHGLLTVGAIISFFLGSVILFGSGASAYGAPIIVIAGGTAAMALFFIFLVGWGAKALKLPVVTGREGIVGRIVEARTDIDPTGKVFTEGTWWTACSEEGPIRQGERVQIVAMKGLKLYVARTDDTTEQEIP